MPHSFVQQDLVTSVEKTKRRVIYVFKFLWFNVVPSPVVIGSISAALTGPGLCSSQGG